MRIKRFISLVLALVMLLSTFNTTAFAADYSKIKAEGSVIKLDGVNPGTATVKLVGVGNKNIYSIEGKWDTSASFEGKEYLELNEITSDIFAFSGLNYADTATGKVVWTDTTFGNPGVVQTGTNILTAIYNVPADTSAGEYEVSFTCEVLTGSDYYPDTTETCFTATITVVEDCEHDLKPINGEVSLDGTNDAEVTVALESTMDQNIFSIEGYWDISENGKDKGFLTLSEISSEAMEFVGFNYADATSGKVVWTDTTLSAPAELERGTKFLTATYSVDAATPAGEYTVGFLCEVFTGSDYTPDTEEIYYTAKIKVTNDGPAHTCGNATVQPGKDATCAEDGWKSYYKCSCGKHYEDSACEKPIEDPEAWKSGNGKLSKENVNHTLGEKVEEKPATHTADKLEGGYYAHFRCSVCNGWFDIYGAEKTEEELTIPAPEHDSNTVIPGKEATCKEAGLTEGKACSFCGKTMVAQEVIAKTDDHQWSDATCNAPKTCAVCGATDGEKLSHDYKIAYQWTEDHSSCTATRTCTRNCGDETSETVTVTPVEVTATCTVAYSKTWTADFEADWAETQQYVENGEKDSNNHTALRDLEAVDPTCEASGLTKGQHCDACDTTVVEQETVSALGHKWSNTEYTWNTNYYSCTAKRTCENGCSDTVTQTSSKDIIQTGTCTEIEIVRYSVTFPEADSSWAKPVTETVNGEKNPQNHVNKVYKEATEATCTEPGRDDGQYCTDCDTYVNGGDIHTDALGHEYEAVVTAPTCTEGGYTTYTCKNGCGDSYVADHVDALGHQEAEAVRENEVPATCTREGSYEAVVYCRNEGCKHEISRETVITDKIAHTPAEAVKENEVPATCTTDGSYDSVVYCAAEGCKAEISREHVVVNATGHTAGEAVEENIVGATCTTAGSFDSVVYCSDCGGELSRTKVVGEALGHDESGAAATCTTAKICAREGCGHVLQAALNHDESGAAATCTTAKICAREGCGHVLQAALDHDYITHKAVAPTCEESGHWDYETCSRCDYTSYTDSTYRPASGHDLKTVDAKEPTCTEAGWAAYEQCGRYGCTYNTKVVKSALGHDIQYHEAKEPTCTEAGWAAYETCSRCDHTTYAHKEALGHDEEKHAGQLPTCTEIGWNEYITCSRCDYTTYSVRNAIGHNEVGHKAKEPTCTEPGWDAYVTCNREGCGHTTFAEKPALGHDMQEHAAKEPTCTEKGWDAYEKCSRCTESTYVEKPALGHEMEHFEAKAPDCENAGWNAYERCSRCGQNNKQEITALGHTEVTDKSVAATCTTTGLTEGKHCSVCGETLVEQKVLEAKGHTEVIDAAKAPTCTEPGLTEGKHCSVCGETLIAQTEVAPIDHDLEAASCTSPAHCKREGCTYTEGEALGHTEVKDEEVPALCEDNGLTEGSHCDVCGTVLVAQQVIEALGHDIQQYEAKKPTYTGAGWNAYEACSRCAYTTKVEIPALEELTITDYDTFLMNLEKLEEIAHAYVLQNPGKDPAALVIKYIRTGVERYNSGSWGIMAGYEDTAFAEYVRKLEDEYNSAVEDEADMLTVSSLKNLKNFSLPNGDVADLGHVFGMMDITYHNSFSQNHMDVGGWLGDTVDLLSLADQFGVSGTLEEMVKDISENYLLQPESTFPEKPIEGSFSLTDMQGDLDGYYIMHNLKGHEYDKGMLTRILENYFTEGLNDVQRADYLLKNRLGGASLREDVRKAVYNAYTGNKMVKTLEDTRDFTSSDLETMKIACCYAVADYLCRLAGDFVDVADNPYYQVFSEESSTLAPGITQDIKFATSADGKQMAYYIATADVTRSDVDVFANYNNNDPGSGWAMQRVLDQANAAQKKYGDPSSKDYIENYNVIASVNGAGFNMSTGEPSGVLVMHNGVEYHAIDGNGFFGILKDGTPVIGTTREYNTKYKGQVRDAIAIFGATLVKDGKIAVNRTEDYYTDRASRTAVGITSTGKVVFMVLDGRQEPFSCGGSMQEIAQIMLEAGCVDAVNLDGGGSTTFVSRPEGGNALEVINSPSDGVQRSVSTSWIVVSTAPSSTAFDHAILDTETNYMTIGSSQQVTAEGVSATGNAAQIPEDAVWAVSDEQIGTITEDGVFTAKDNGSVEILLMQGQTVIGSKTMNIVQPNNVYFNKSKIDMVYGESVVLPVRVLYDGKDVTAQASDLVFELEKPAAGTIDGFTFTGSSEGSVKSTKLTVSLAHNPDIKASITIALYNQGEATFNFDMATGGDRQFAWDRKISNTTTEDAVTYSVVNPDEDMVTSYIFAIDMTQIPIPSELDELIYMLPGSDIEGASAWTFLLQLAQRVSVLTEVRPVVQIDPNFEVDCSDIKLVNEYFDLKKVELDEETNTLTMTLKWKKQTQAIDPAEANPMCILSGIKLTPREDAAWNDKDSLTAVHSGKVGYEIYLRASSLYTFAQKPENQKAFGLKPFVNPDDSSEAGASFSDIYCEFSDTYTLVKALKNGWVSEGDGFAYYADGEKYTGVRLIDGAYYDFGETGINAGRIKYTGTFFDADAQVYRYAKDGVLGSGWISIGKEWYYFTENGNAAAGEYKIDGITYTFEENGRLTTGVWVNTKKGSMYYYGPSYHVKGWKEIDGKTYYFKDNYCVKGRNPINNGEVSTLEEWYDFDENGALIGKLADTGLIKWNGKYYYVVNGESQYGMQYVDGYYYYFSRGDHAAVTGNYYVTLNNGLMPSGTYKFDSKGRMTVSQKTGLYKESDAYYYYVNGKKTYAGLIFYDGYYYYINSSKKAVTGTYYVSKHNDLLPAGNYEFDSQGRMIMSSKYDIVEENDAIFIYDKYGHKCIDELIRIDSYTYCVDKYGKIVVGKYTVTGDNGVLPPDEYEFDEQGRLIVGNRDGFVEKDGAIYYYVDGIKNYAGLIYVDGYYYYVNSQYRVVTGSYTISKNNNLLPIDTYQFDGLGRMIVKNGIIRENGEIRYYVNGERPYAGLVYVDGYYYYINSKLKVVTGTYYVSKHNDLMPSGNYKFDSQGRMIIENEGQSPNLKNGIIRENGELRYYVNGERPYAGLIYVDGYYYYVNSKLKVVTGTYYVAKNNGLMPSANYKFDSQGRMIIEGKDEDQKPSPSPSPNPNPNPNPDVDPNLKNGIMRENGELRYYVNGERPYAGLVYVNGYYYYINSKLKVVTGTYYVAKHNNIMPSGNYKFDSDGRMILKNGIIRENGKLYYYVNGQRPYAGLIYVDGYYYYVNSKLKVVTGTYYVAKNNGLMPSANYKFDSQGRMILG